MYVIAVLGLWKRLGGRWVLRDVTLKVSGLVVLVGPNGSGKTTLVKAVAGLLEPTRGRVEVDGRPPPVPPRLLGVALHGPMLYPELTVRENLELFSRLAGGRLEGCPLGVCRVMDRPVKALSFGWRRRVDLVRALLPDPPNLALDEPMAGLDEEARGQLLDLLRGRDVLLTTPAPLGVGAEVEIHEVSGSD